MIARSFDDLSRVFARRSGRRSVLGVLLLGSSAVAAAPLVVDAKQSGANKKKKVKCKQCETRQGNKCIPKLNNFPCKNDGLCYEGRCIAQPTCKPANFSPCTTVGANPLCCSGTCDIAAGITYCAQSPLGGVCLTDDDCMAGSCIGYVCREP